MIPDRYPPAAWLPVTFADGTTVADAGPFAAPPIGWILHVVTSDGSPRDYFRGLRSPARKFSHLWFAKSGRVEQYGPLSGKSWAQGSGGNGTWWSCETEGRPGEPLTGPQLDALAAWHVWCGAPDVVSSSPSTGGIGTHAMGGAAWGGHRCPGDIRAGQRPEILRRAAVLRASSRKDTQMPTADEIAKAVLARLAGWKPPAPENAPGSGVPAINWQTMISRDHAQLAALADDVEQLAAALARIEARLPGGTAS